jgi:hypothetical protein
LPGFPAEATPITWTTLTINQRNGVGINCGQGRSGGERGGLVQLSCDDLTWVTNAAHAPGETSNVGPSGSLESRTATA